MGEHREHKNIAYAKGYLTGRDHYRQIPYSHIGSVRRKAYRGYKRGFKDAVFEGKQHRLVVNERRRQNYRNNH